MGLGPGKFRARGGRVALAAALVLLVSTAHAREHVVQPGETLLSIASAHRSAYPKARLSQIAWGLIRANPEVFPAGPAKLKRGTRLLLPTAATVSDTEGEAAAENIQALYDAHGQTPPVALRARVAAPKAILPAAAIVSAESPPVPAAAASAAAIPAEAYGPTQDSEALWSIAGSFKSKRPGMTTAQIAWALYRANPAAFKGHPNLLRPQSMLTIPDLEFIAAVDPSLAFAYITGKTPLPEIAVAQPPLAPGLPATTAAPRPADPPPVIAGIELLPAVGMEIRQWLAVSGSGFAPGARLELFDVANGRAFAARVPATVKADRLEYQAGFRKTPSPWRIAVRNPDGQKSAPFEFEAGRDVMLVLGPGALQQARAVTAPPPSNAFRESADERSLSAEPEQRYQQLAALEERYAGDVDYDYGYGSAAVDTGNFSQAVFPLQRAVATKPDFAGARLELARAYFGVGDNETARREFTSLRAEQPPPQVDKMIQQYLDAIDRRAVEYQIQRSAYAEFAAGHDSNANGATDSQVFLGFNLNDRSRATASPYYGLNAGGLFSYPIVPGWRTQADAQLSARKVLDASFVDSTQARGGAALEWRNTTFTVNSALSYAYAELDGVENNRNAAIDLNASMSLGDHWQLGVGARRAELRFVDSLSNQNTNSHLFSLAVSTAAGGALWSGGVTAGRDQAQAQTSPFGRDLQGARLSALLDAGRSRYLTGSLGALRSDYEGEFFTGMPRDDTQYSAQAGLEWRDFPVRLWDIRTQLTYVDNRSNIVLFDYNRFDIGLAVRREFR